MPAPRKVDKYIDRICPVCQTIYRAEVSRLTHGRQTTCSRTCSYKLRAKNNEDQISLTCGLCGKEFTRPRSTVKGKYGTNFCSSSCHYAGRGVGLTKRVVVKPYIYTDEGAISLSRHGARTKRVMPPAEQEAQTALARLGIPIVSQQVFDFDTRSIAVDFFLPTRGTVVEIDGPDHRKKFRRDDAERDALLSALGIRVVRIKHGEGEAGLEGLQERVLRAIKP